MWSSGPYFHTASLADRLGWPVARWSQLQDVLRMTGRFDLDPLAWALFPRYFWEAGDHDQAMSLYERGPHGPVRAARGQPADRDRGRRQYRRGGRR